MKYSRWSTQDGICLEVYSPEILALVFQVSGMVLYENEEWIQFFQIWRIGCWNLWGENCKGISCKCSALWFRGVGIFWRRKGLVEKGKSIWESPYFIVLPAFYPRNQIQGSLSNVVHSSWGPELGEWRRRGDQSCELKPPHAASCYDYWQAKKHLASQTISFGFLYGSL